MKPAPRRTLLVLAAVTALAGARSAMAQKKPAAERARTEIGELRYEDALKTVEKAIRSGTNGPDGMSELYLLLGEVKASLGDEGAAQDAFRRALAIDPSVELREGLSPKIREPFAQARRAMKSKKPLAIAHRILKPDPPTIAVLVQSDPFGMIVGGRLVFKNASGAERSVAAIGKARVDLKLPPGTDAFVVAGIDEHGNRIIELGSEGSPLTLDVDSGGGSAQGEEQGPKESGGEADATVSEGDEPGGRPFYAHWTVWGGVSLGLAGLGVLAGLSTRSAINELDDVRQNSEDYEFSHAQAVADKAERRALMTNITFAAAGACAVVSAVLFFRRDSGRSSEERAALVPVIGPDGAGISAHLRF